MKLGFLFDIEKDEYSKYFYANRTSEQKGH